MILEFKFPAESSSLPTTCPAELNQCMYGSLIVPLNNVMVTDVPAAMPFKTQVSHGLLRGLRPPVPLPEIVVGALLTAEATLSVNINIASDAAITENRDRAVNLIMDERRESTGASRIKECSCNTIFTTNSAVRTLCTKRA